MRKSLFVLSAFCLFMAACSKKVESGAYLFESDSVSGFLLVNKDQSGTLYPDQNLLFSDPIAVTLKQKKKVRIYYLDGNSFEAVLKPYVPPEFHLMSGIKPYRDPRFKVRIERDVRYASALGFWTSYPDENESPIVTYGRKAPEWLSDREELDLTMDIYCPEDSAALRPLLLLIHGGAFFNGDKASEPYVKLGRHFASLGYVVASINYRLGYRPTPNEVDRAGYRAVQDANAAVRYLLQQETLAIDPRLIFVAGASAGAITALNLAYMQDHNRPAITRGGFLGDEGAIDALVPPLPQTFTVRAIGNLWGAISDTTMLRNSRVPVVSFQSQNDGVVPYEIGHPFSNLFASGSQSPVRKAFESVMSAVHFNEVNELVFREMYGCRVIDRVLRRNSVHSELHSYPDKRHSLFLDDAGQIIPSIFQEIQDGLEVFFSSEMAPIPVSLKRDDEDPQLFFIINDAEVSACYWKVEGGVVIGVSPNSLRALMFSDATENSVTISGTYDSGMAFNETISLEK